MPSQEVQSSIEGKTLTARIFDALAEKDFERVKQLVLDNPGVNLNCVDKDELTPLQHACHYGNAELTNFFIEKGAQVDYTQRKDGYTPLMFAAISSRDEVVRVLLEAGADTTIENCVNRTAAQMAAFVGQSKIVSIINNWVPYQTTVEPFTKCRELEDKPRISSQKLGRLLHSYIVYPSLHPIKLMIFIKENLELVRCATEIIYVLESLSSKALRPPSNEESLSLKYYYSSYLIDFCSKQIKSRQKDDSDLKLINDEKCRKRIDLIIRKLIEREDPEDIKPSTQQLDQFIVQCVMKFPYTQLAIFKTMAFALSKREPGSLNALAVLMQTLNGPRMFGHSAEACSICGELDKNKKCSKCRSVYYCGPACQLADWFQHKRVCKSLEEKPLLGGTGDED